MIDKQGKLFGLINAIDLFVLVSLTAVLVFGVFRFGNVGGVGILERPSPITMSFLIEALEDFTANSVREGDPVSDNASGVFLGHIINIDKSPAVEYHPNAAGIMVPGFFPNHYTVEITTELEGYRFPNGVWISGHTFLVGETIVIAAGNTNIFMRISNINF